MATFRKKPVEIEARQFSSGNTVKICEWMAEHGCRYSTDTDPFDGSKDVIRISTLEGEMRATDGDWIIRGVKGEFYPCRADIFEATYEPVESA